MKFPKGKSDVLLFAVCAICALIAIVIYRITGELPFVAATRWLVGKIRG